MLQSVCWVTCPRSSLSREPSCSQVLGHDCPGQGDCHPQPNSWHLHFLAIYHLIRGKNMLFVRWEKPRQLAAAKHNLLQFSSRAIKLDQLCLWSKFELWTAFLIVFGVWSHLYLLKHSCCLVAEIGLRLNLKMFQHLLVFICSTEHKSHDNYLQNYQENMVEDHLFYIPLWWLLLPPPWLTAATGVLATGAQTWERAVSARNKTARAANVSTGFHPGKNVM